MHSETDSINSLAPLGTVAAVADYLSVSRSKVYQMMGGGELPYVKLGRCRRVYWKDVESLLAQNHIGRP